MGRNNTLRWHGPQKEAIKLWAPSRWNLLALGGFSSPTYLAHLVVLCLKELLQVSGPSLIVTRFGDEAVLCRIS